MVVIGLIVVVSGLVGLFLIIKLINKYGVVEKRLPQLIVKREIVATGNVKRQTTYCVQGKCFKTKPEARIYAEQIARKI